MKSPNWNIPFRSNIYDIELEAKITRSDAYLRHRLQSSIIRVNWVAVLPGRVMKSLNYLTNVAYKQTVCAINHSNERIAIHRTI